MYWLIYKNKNKLSGNKAMYFDTYEEIEQYAVENESLIEIVDIAIPYDITMDE